MSNFRTSDEVSLFYVEKGKGKPIIFIHGWSGDHSSFLPQLEELSKEYRVIAYDHRGHGNSDRPEKGLTLERFARDLKELMDHLELKDLILAGWSMGAQTIFQYAESYGMDNISGVVLYDMTPKLINDNNWSMGLWHGSYMIEDALDDMTTMCDNFDVFQLAFMKRAFPYLTEEMIKEMPAPPIPNTPHIMYSMWLAMAYNDYRESIRKITVPTVIAYGEGSTLYSPETAQFMAERIPNSQIMPFPNCTHGLVLENPALTTEAVRKLLK